MAVYVATTGTAPAAACAAIESYLPSGHGFDTVVEWTPIIAEATAFVDSRLAPKYWPFPDVAATPATPTIIQAIAARYGAYVALLKLMASSRFNDTSRAEYLRATSEKELDDLCDDKLAAQVPASTVSAEVIDMGSGSVSTEHKLLCGRRTVVPESVVVTNSGATVTYVNNTDYYIYYNTEYQATMLVGVNAAIVDGFKVTYDYSHLKRQELDLPPAFDTVRLVRS